MWCNLTPPPPNCTGDITHIVLEGALFFGGKALPGTEFATDEVLELWAWRLYSQISYVGRLCAHTVALSWRVGVRGVDVVSQGEHGSLAPAGKSIRFTGAWMETAIHLCRIPPVRSHACCLVCKTCVRFSPAYTLSLPSDPPPPPPFLFCVLCCVERFDEPPFQTSRLLLKLLGVMGHRRVLLAAVSVQLFDANRVLRSGRWALRMWHVQPILVSSAAESDSAVPLSIRAGVCTENTQSPTSPVALFDFDSFLLPVVAPAPDFRMLSGLCCTCDVVPFTTNRVRAMALTWLWRAVFATW